MLTWAVICILIGMTFGPGVGLTVFVLGVVAAIVVEAIYS